VGRLRTLLAALYAFSFLLVLAPVAFAAGLVDRRQRLHDVFAILWSEGILRIIGVKIEGGGAHHAARGERFLVAANHQSAVDIMAIEAVIGRRLSLRFVAKQGNFRVPILGWAMRMFGHIRVDPSNARRSLEGLRLATAVLASRHSVIFFPEGTRSRTGQIGSFRPSPFRIALRAGVRILPVTIDGAFDAMPPRRWWVRPGSRVRVTVHAPFGPLEGDPVGAAARCQEIIESALPEARRGLGSTSAGAAAARD
jgi:1-acyl-sn-glycerol-3-phosphate acyltransferase